MYLTVVVLVQFSVPVLTQGLLLLLRHAATGALFDPLTGLRNRRGLAQELARSFTGVDFGEHTLFVVLVIDLDNFKAVNDRHGHHCGDVVLARAAGHIRTVFTDPAVACRSGGEEFTVVTRSSVSDAFDYAHRLRVLIGADTGTTVSIGVCTHRCDNACAHKESIAPVFTLLARGADAAMYLAKRSGGDAVMFGAQSHA